MLSAKWGDFYVDKFTSILWEKQAAFQLLHTSLLMWLLYVILSRIMSINDPINDPARLADIGLNKTASMYGLAYNLFGENQEHSQTAVHMQPNVVAPCASHVIFSMGFANLCMVNGGADPIFKGKRTCIHTFCTATQPTP